MKVIITLPSGGYWPDPARVGGNERANKTITINARASHITSISRLEHVLDELNSELETYKLTLHFNMQNGVNGCFGLVSLLMGALDFESSHGGSSPSDSAL